jgi:hypothetical protein
MCVPARRALSVADKNAEDSPEAVANIEAAFNQQVQYVAPTNSEYQKTRQIISELEKESHKPAS